MAHWRRSPQERRAAVLMTKSNTIRILINVKSREYASIILNSWVAASASHRRRFRLHRVPDFFQLAPRRRVTERLANPCDQLPRRSAQALRVDGALALL